MNNKTITLTALLITPLILGACGTAKSPITKPMEEEIKLVAEASPAPIASATATPINQKEIVMNYAVIKTSKGEIKVKLYPEVAPKTVTNFATKASNGFYKNLTFHRVEDWVIQGGDPLGNGTGGGKIETELSDTPFKKGSLGVARGPIREVSNDAQFFICTQDCDWLTGDYTNFGEVTEGMDVALKIEPGDKITAIEVLGDE